MAENVVGLTDTGRVRENNEDTFIAEQIQNGTLIITCVIDGVGGYAYGEVAAAVAREAILDCFARPSAELPAVDIMSTLKASLITANERIFAEKQRDSDYDKMACVLTLAVVDTENNQFRYAHVGDTRLYLLRDDSLVKIAQDHSFVGFIEDTGRLSEAAAMRHPKRNEINKALGFLPRIDTPDDYIETGQSPFLPGDTLLLCSDGLTDLVTKKEITDILTGAGSLAEKGTELVAAANEKGGKDNITVVLVRHDKPPFTPPAILRPAVGREVDGPTEKPARVLPASSSTKHEPPTARQMEIAVQKTPPSRGRGLDRVFLGLITAVLGLLFHTLFTVLQGDFKDVDGRLRNGTMVNLDGPNNPQTLATLLGKGYYFDDERDIQFIRAAIADARNADASPLDNVGELNKRRFSVLADDTFSRGGNSFKKRVTLYRSLLGFAGSNSSRLYTERAAPPPLPSVTDAGLDGYRLSGTVRTEADSRVAGVLVRLAMILPPDNTQAGDGSRATDVTENKADVQKVYELDAGNNRRLRTLTAFARMDAQGAFASANLPGGRAFEMLPMQPGYQFGASQGVSALTQNSQFTFYRTPHALRLLSTRDFTILKKEKSLIVRTPAEFNWWYQLIVSCFFGGFLLIHLLVSLRFRQADQLILLVVMLLTGLFFITLLSLQDPLLNRLLAKDSLTYFGIGLVGFGVLLFLNLRKFTLDSGLYRLLIFRKDRRAANG